MIKWRQNAYNGKMLFRPCLNACYDKLSFGLCLNACSDKWRIHWQSFRSLFNRTMEVWSKYLYILFSLFLRYLAGKNTNITLAYLINLSIWLYAYTKIHDKIFSIDMTNVSLWVIEKCGCRHPHYQFRACFITCICQNESTHFYKTYIFFYQSHARSTAAMLWQDANISLTLFIYRGFPLKSHLQCYFMGGMARSRSVEQTDRWQKNGLRSHREYKYYTQRVSSFNLNYYMLLL